MGNLRDQHVSSSMSHFEGLLVHLFALSTPVLFYPWMTDVTRIKTLVGLLICGSLLSVHVLRRNCDSRPIRGFRLIFTLYCSWTFLSCLWSVSPIASTAEIIRLCSSLALMLVIPSLSLLRKPAIHPARSLALITAVVSAYAVLQSANLDPLVWSKPTGDGVVSTLGHPNALGAFLIIGIAAQMIEIAGRVDRISRYFYGFPLIFLSFIAMGLSMSKGAWMGVACGLFVYWLLGARTPARTRVSFLAGLIIIAGITAALLPGSFLSDLVQTNQFRIQTYRQSLRIYTDDFSPLEKLVGTGAGTYSHAFDRFRDPSYLVRFKHAANLEHAHSEPIEILLETGIIGLGLFSCFICFVIRFAWRNRSEFSVRVWTSASMGLVFHNLVCVNMRWFVPWTFWILAIADRKSVV